MKALPITLFLLCLGLLALAQSPNYDAELRQVYPLYQSAIEGDKSASRDAERALSELAEHYPNDPVMQLLHGSSQTLRGRDAWLPWNKLSHTEDGLDQMARALRLLTDAHQSHAFEGLPVPTYVRMTAAINFISVPDMFGRFEHGYDLLQQLSNDPDTALLPDTVQATIHYYTAQAAEKVNDATVKQQALQRLYAINGDEPLKQRAQERWGGE